MEQVVDVDGGGDGGGGDDGLVVWLKEEREETKATGRDGNGSGGSPRGTVPGGLVVTGRERQVPAVPPASGGFASAKTNVERWAAEVGLSCGDTGQPGPRGWSAVAELGQDMVRFLPGWRLQSGY
ncbi:hypothetical protein ColTof4_11519 [Colletotrichum tofieldiae]|nr:hypothetical protein ColTof3_04711 [Colletotrichum tofieldiae]GKT79096.1 hypothetical protein ColTof4_11519 [Colletotrichum tofieldiae]